MVGFLLPCLVSLDKGNSMSCFHLPTCSFILSFYAIFRMKFAIYVRETFRLALLVVYLFGFYDAHE